MSRIVDLFEAIDRRIQEWQDIASVGGADDITPAHLVIAALLVIAFVVHRRRLKRTEDDHV